MICNHCLAKIFIIYYSIDIVFAFSIFLVHTDNENFSRCTFMSKWFKVVRAILTSFPDFSLQMSLKISSILLIEFAQSLKICAIDNLEQT